jgi:serine/threonine protein phosphatase PrpC
MEMYAISDTGNRRRHNEDRVRTIPAQGIAVLADGMGGHQAGEVASAIAVDHVVQQLQSALPSAKSLSAPLQQAIETANRTIFERAQQRPEYAGMATTLVAALFHKKRLYLGSVGDSRMYRLRDGVLTHMTEDHSLVQEQVRLGLLTADDARRSSKKNLITRALGIAEEVEADLVEEAIQESDLYLICSDGLTTVVPDEAIRLLLIEHGDDLRMAADELVALANDAGGPDNISVILIRTDHSKKSGHGWSRLLGARR